MKGGKGGGKGVVREGGKREGGKRGGIKRGREVGKRGQERG